MRAYRSSEAGLTAFLLWAETHDMTPTEELLRVGVERGWFTPEEVDVDEVEHLRAVAEGNRLEINGANKRIAALEEALRALVDDDPLCFEPGDTLGTCLYCERWRKSADRPVDHDPECPVAKARALLSQSPPPAGSSDTPGPSTPA